MTQVEPTADWSPRIAESQGPLYRRIVLAIEDDICRGTLPLGCRLPTHRELADRLGIAIGTVTRAYKEAEKSGLVHGRGRRGTIVGKAPKGKTSIARVFELSTPGEELRGHLAFGSQHPDLSRTLQRLARKPETQSLLRYEPQTTFPPLKNAGALWLARMGIETDPKSVVTTCGAHHGLFLALATEASHGDTILTEAHTYFGLIEIANLLGLKLVGIAADREGMIPEALDAACRRGNPRLLFCNFTVQNPTATTMPEDRRREILAIAERHDLTIIEDDVLQPQVDTPPPLLKSLAPERCYLITSVSKVLSPGLRVGFAVPPTRSRARFIESLRTTTLMLPTLPLAIVASWLNDGTADRTIRKAKQEAQARQQLTEHILPANFVYATPVSYYIWLQLPEQWTPSAFTAEATRYGVHVLPSELFAVDAASTANAVRFVVGRSVNRVVLKESLEVLKGLLETGPSARMAVD